MRLVVAGEPERLERAAVTLTGEYGDGVSLWRLPGARAWIAGRRPSYCALAALTAGLGIAPSRVAYAGDAADDAPAWGWAGFGIAVGGAPYRPGGRLGRECGARRARGVAAAVVAGAASAAGRRRVGALRVGPARQPRAQAPDASGAVWGRALARTKGAAPAARMLRAAMTPAADACTRPRVTPAPSPMA